MATVRKMIGDDYAEDRNRERNDDLAAAMERAFAETSGQTEGFDAATEAEAKIMGDASARRLGTWD